MFILFIYLFRRSILNNVSDIFIMGGCIILEALVLFNWCKRHGYGPLGVSGLSMGGHVRIVFIVHNLLVLNISNFIFICIRTF